MSQFTTREFESHWKKIGYFIPNDSGIQDLHQGYYKIIQSKITSLDQIFGAFFATTKDRNGFSMGIFMACSDCFAYAAAYPERDVAVLELLPYEQIKSFGVALDKKKNPTALVINIYDKDVKIIGYKQQIPDIFMKKLNEAGILKSQA